MLCIKVSIKAPDDSSSSGNVTSRKLSNDHVEDHRSPPLDVTHHAHLPESTNHVVKRLSHQVPSTDRHLEVRKLQSRLLRLVKACV